MLQKKIGIVTVTYNSASFLDDFFDSMDRQSFENWRCYVVENNSVDRTREVFSRRALGDYRYSIILNSENVGIAAGNNQGIQRAIDDGCDWILLLNNDTSFQSHFIEDMAVAAENNNFQVIVCKIFFDIPKGVIWYGGGGFNSRRGYTGYHVGIGESDSEQYNQSKVVEYAPTCAMLVNKKIFIDVGLMDESYFVYFDDTDFCWRLKQKGIQIGYTGDTHLVHKVGGSTGGVRSPFTARMTSRNRLYFLKKHFGMAFSLGWILAFLGFYFFRFGLRGEWTCLRACVRGSFEFWRMTPSVPTLNVD